MVCKLSANCDLIFGILSCYPLDNIIDVDLRVCTLQGIHMCKKDRSTQVIKFSPWGTEVEPFPSLQKKMLEFLRCRKISATLANRSFQSRPKATATRKHNQVILTRPNREKLSQPREGKVGPYPPATQRNWLASLKAKEARATASSQVTTPTQPSKSTSKSVPYSTHISWYKVLWNLHSFRKNMS